MHLWFLPRMKQHCVKESSLLCPEHSHRLHVPANTLPPPSYYIQLEITAGVQIHEETGRSVGEEKQQSCKEKWRNITKGRYNFSLNELRRDRIYLFFLKENASSAEGVWVFKWSGLLNVRKIKFAKCFSVLCKPSVKLNNNL